MDNTDMNWSPIDSIASLTHGNPWLPRLSQSLAARWPLSGRGRRARYMLAALAIFLLSPLVAQANWSPPESAWPAPMTFCWPQVLFDPQMIAVLPPGRYLYSDAYGWFDSQHFRTGDPRQVIRDVAQAIGSGGGFISIEQGVRADLTGYWARYWISGELTQQDVLPTALGVYLDWSVRFEAWQGEPPRSIVGPMTPFSVEDLPSQYLGFFAAAHGLDCAQVFACFLGPIQGTDDTPPHLIFFDDRTDLHSPEVLGVRRLVNIEFTPKIATEEAWTNIPWPEPMQMEPAEPSDQWWLFVDDATWYFEP